MDINLTGQSLNSFELLMFIYLFIFIMILFTVWFEYKRGNIGNILSISPRIKAFKIGLLQQQEIQKIEHTYLYAISLGLDIQKMPLNRFLPVRIYIAGDILLEENALKSVAKEVRKGIFDFLDISVADEFTPETGSWWERIIAKTNTAITQPEVNERLRRLERAIEIQGLDRPQSEIDKNEANAISTIITAIHDVPSVTIQAGTVLLFKLTDDKGKAHIHARTLSQMEMIYFEKNQNILKDQPEDVLKHLAEFNRAIPDQNHQDSSNHGKR